MAGRSGIDVWLTCFEGPIGGLGTVHETVGEVQGFAFVIEELESDATVRFSNAFDHSRLVVGIQQYMATGSDLPSAGGLVVAEQITA